MPDSILVTLVSGLGGWVGRNWKRSIGKGIVKNPQVPVLVRLFPPSRPDALVMVAWALGLHEKVFSWRGCVLGLSWEERGGLREKAEGAVGSARGCLVSTVKCTRKALQGLAFPPTHRAGQAHEAHPPSARVFGLEEELS